MDIIRKTKELTNTIIPIRRHLHKNPELSNKEFETSKFIAEKLKEIGLDVTTGVGKTGVVGILKGKKPGKTIALRADMDALPITEETGLDFSSVNHGVMHACGHDMHTSILIGCAYVLSEVRDELCGNIKFIFQPAEEKLVGAKQMIDDGVLDNPKVDAIIGLHCWPDFKTGTIGVKRGTVLASGDFLDIQIKGKQGHAAYPHKTIDPIVIAGHVLTSLQTVVSREISPVEPVVITIGKIMGGTAFNIIPESVYLSGTVRIVNNKIRNKMPKKIERNISNTAKSMNGEAYVDYRFGSPPLTNNESLVDLLANTVKNTQGDYNLEYMDKPTLGSEDFAYFSEQVPSLFFRLGTSKANNDNNYPLHHPKVIFDEDSIAIGIALMSEYTINYLNN